jgi:hypothetical protein
VDWFKVDSTIWTNPKVEDLSDRAYRAMTYVWGYAMQRETGGYVPHNIARLIPRVTVKAIEELEGQGFLRRNGNGWHIHDWEDHQREALAVQDKRRRDAERKKAKRAEEGADAT